MDEWEKSDEASSSPDLGRKKRKSTLLLGIVGCLLVLGLAAFFFGRLPVLAQSSAWGSKEGQACIQCHSVQNAVLVEEWRLGAHGQRGVNCADCHRADKSDPDAMEHNGYLISTLVTPKDCSRCHQKEVNEQKGSHHAQAGQILASLDDFLGQVVTGPPAAATGCWQCHGSTVKVLPGGKLDPTTWPNTGIGRINPDGSWGSCSACHTRHAFSKAQARQPQTCGKCHLGPDHPQIEVYQESKHGILYEANKERLNLDRDHWVVGVDYSAAPTCAMTSRPSSGCSTFLPPATVSSSTRGRSSPMERSAPRRSAPSWRSSAP